MHAPPESPPERDEEIPLGQRFFDNVFLLLALGMVIMLIVYTGWGVWEIFSMPTSTLP